jgi:hypothetical protein
MNDGYKLERKKSWFIEVVSQHLPGGPEENHGHFQSGYPVSGHRIRLGICSSAFTGQAGIVASFV